jgi:adenylyl-sulfate kinase
MTAVRGGAPGLTVWLTGLSSAGKTTISRLLHETLQARGERVEWLDGDAMRRGLSADLGFSKKDRDENVRRVGYVAELLTRHGVIVLVSAISPYRALRNEMRRRIGNFLEVHIHAPLAVCEQRDVKGIYQRARAENLRQVTGLDDPYEPPLAPEIVCHTYRETPQESAARVLAAIETWQKEAWQKADAAPGNRDAAPEAPLREPASVHGLEGLRPLT